MRIHVAIQTTIYVAILLLAASASAQDRQAGMKLPLTVLGLAASTDVVSTFTSAGNTEGNPVVSWLNPHAGLAGTVAVGAAIEVTAIWAMCRLMCESHPKAAKVLTYIGAGLHGAAAATNWSNRSLHQRQKAFGR